MAVILLVEDDFALAMGTEYALQAEGYTVIHAGDLEAARVAFHESETAGREEDIKVIDLILLDVMLPDGTGFDFCREVRSENPQVPIIFLTAVGEEANIVQGLELGADDYVTKPYHVRELLSRIAANLRRFRLSRNTGEAEPEEYVFGVHRFYMKEFRLFCQNHPVELTSSEFRLLKELIKNEGVVLTRNQLLERVYDTEDAFVDDNTLSVYVKRLRDKLTVDADWIQTVRGVGYRFKKRGGTA